MGGYGWGVGGVDGVKDAVVGWRGGGGMHGMMLCCAGETAVGHDCPVLSSQLEGRTQAAIFHLSSPKPSLVLPVTSIYGEHPQHPALGWGPYTLPVLGQLWLQGPTPQQPRDVPQSPLICSHLSCAERWDGAGRAQMGSFLPCLLLCTVISSK